MGDEWPDGFGIGLYFLPIGVALEFGPIFLGGVAAFVREDVNQRVFGFWLVLGNPIADVRHAVLFEKFDRVIAEAVEQGVKLAVGGGVGADFEDTVGRLRIGRGAGGNFG